MQNSLVQFCELKKGQLTFLASGTLPAGEVTVALEFVVHDVADASVEAVVSGAGWSWFLAGYDETGQKDVDNLSGHNLQASLGLVDGVATIPVET